MAGTKTKAKAAFRKLLRIDEVEVTIEECGHCGARPGFADARMAVAGCPPRFCAVCNGSITVLKLDLAHVSGPGRRGVWLAREVTFEKSFHFKAHEGAGFALHTKCARRALPHAPWEKLRPTVLMQW